MVQEDAPQTELDAIQEQIGRAQMDYDTAPMEEDTPTAEIKMESQGIAQPGRAGVAMSPTRKGAFPFLQGERVERAATSVNISKVAKRVLNRLGPDATKETIINSMSNTYKRRWEGVGAEALSTNVKARLWRGDYATREAAMSAAGIDAFIKVIKTTEVDRYGNRVPDVTRQYKYKVLTIYRAFAPAFRSVMENYKASLGKTVAEPVVGFQDWFNKLNPAKPQKLDIRKDEVVTTAYSQKNGQDRVKGYAEEFNKEHVNTGFRIDIPSGDLPKVRLPRAIWSDKRSYYVFTVKNIHDNKTRYVVFDWCNVEFAKSRKYRLVPFVLSSKFTPEEIYQMKQRSLQAKTQLEHNLGDKSHKNAMKQFKNGLRTRFLGWVKLTTNQPVQGIRIPILAEVDSAVGEQVTLPIAGKKHEAATWHRIYADKSNDAGKAFFVARVRIPNKNKSVKVRTSINAEPEEIQTATKTGTVLVKVLMSSMREPQIKSWNDDLIFVDGRLANKSKSYVSLDY
jgi:hypothetical protein